MEDKELEQDNLHIGLFKQIELKGGMKYIPFPIQDLQSTLTEYRPYDPCENDPLYINYKPMKPFSTESYQVVTMDYSNNTIISSNNIVSPEEYFINAYTGTKIKINNLPNSNIIQE